MSRSIHTTQRDFKSLTGKEVSEQLQDPDSDLRKLARKSLLKEDVKRNRKNKKKDPSNAEILRPDISV